MLIIDVKNNRVYKKVDNMEVIYAVYIQLNNMQSNVCDYVSHSKVTNTQRAL